MIRPATPQDAPAICAIWNPIIRDSVITFNPTERTVDDIAALILARQAEGHAFLVAEQAGHILGFATYFQFRGGLGYRHCMEHTINLAPESRGQGIGPALMSALEDHARARGVHVMVAAITGTNAASIGFHARMGYVQVGRMAEVGAKFGQWHDLVLMQKIL